MANLKKKVKNGILIAGIGLLGASCGNKNKQATFKENVEPEPVKTEYVAPAPKSEKQETAIFVNTPQKLYSRTDSLNFAKGGWEFLSPEQQKVANEVLQEYEKIENSAWSEFVKSENAAWGQFSQDENLAWSEFNKSENAAWSQFSKDENTAWAEFSKTEKTAIKLARENREKAIKTAREKRETAIKSARKSREQKISGPFIAFWNKVTQIKNQVQSKINQRGN